MRPFIASLVVLFAAAGCTENSNPSAFEPEYSVRVIGAFERLNPNDPDSRWVGMEVTRIVDHQGTLICENEVDAEGLEVEDPDAELSLEMVRDAARVLPCCREGPRFCLSVSRCPFRGAAVTAARQAMMISPRK